MLIKKITAAETWPLRQKVMWPNKPIEFIQLEGDDTAVHYGLYKDGVLVSVISCFENNTEMQFRKFATLQQMQGQGLGTALLSFVIDDAKNRGIKKIWCNARTDKKKFYEKFGLAHTGKEFLKSGIVFTIMEMEV
jgi:predicted GNAT family N-acyltransferase